MELGGGGGKMSFTFYVILASASDYTKCGKELPVRKAGVVIQALSEACKYTHPSQPSRTHSLVNNSKM